jgi:non-haem Fe2+, alpha-ketoglutarate-dependent halogenase
VASLPKAAVDHFRAEGYYFPHRVIPADEAAELCRQFQEFDGSPAARANPNLHADIYLFKPHLIFGWADRIVHHPGVLDAVESIVGPDILAWSAGVFKKDPQSAAIVTWHQDATYYGLDELDAIVRCWVALTPTRERNGTMRFAPRTHLLGVRPHRSASSADNLLSFAEEVEIDVDESKTVPVILDPGEASFHHLTLAHSSGPNMSDEPRINLVVTYIATRVKPLNESDSAMLVRGRDAFGYYDLERRPERGAESDALRRHQTAMDLRKRNFDARRAASTLNSKQ